LVDGTTFENHSTHLFRINELQALGLKVGRAYAIKETFDNFWNYRYSGLCEEVL
jgi:hypothetical protein